MSERASGITMLGRWWSKVNGRQLIVPISVILVVCTTGFIYVHQQAVDIISSSSASDFVVIPTAPLSAAICSSNPETAILVDKPITTTDDVDDASCPSESLAISTCSCKADRRGLRQNVVAYSLYGNFSDPEIIARYVDPMKNVIDFIRRAYPGWIIRIYTQMDYRDEDSNRMLNVY